MSRGSGSRRTGCLRAWKTTTRTTTTTTATTGCEMTRSEECGLCCSSLTGEERERKEARPKKNKAKNCFCSVRLGEIHESREYNT